jgi:uncharacterized phiE125 gp8 family phage protein
MSLTLNTPPAEEPVTLAEAKAHLKVDGSDDDALIAALIAAARARAEWHSGRAFVAQAWTYWLDAWPRFGPVEIPLPPLIGVTKVATYARDDSSSVLDAATYHVDCASAPGRLALKNALSPPVVTLREIAGVEICFTAGYGDAAAVPQGVKQAILVTVADLYENRGDDDALVGARAQALLAPYRIFKL